MFIQVIIAILLGVLVGLLFPSFAVDLKILATLFIRFIKMVITPVVFFSIVLGICSQHKHTGIGVIAFRTLVYFEIMSIVAIFIALAFVLFFQPGSYFNVIAGHVDISSLKLPQDNNSNIRDFITHMVPDNALSALAGDNLIAVIVFAVIFAISALHLESTAKIIDLFTSINEIFFRMIAIISKFSPIAAFAAIAATVGHEGLSSLVNLGYFVFVLVLSMLAFWIVLYIVARFYRFDAFKLIKHIKEELFIALGTSSSESVFPQLMQKLESFGCSKKIVGFVLPAGYAFNLDGTAIYVTAGAFFIAQAYHVPLDFSAICAILFTILIISKGAAGITGAGFVTLSAVLVALPNQMVPVEGLALLLGIDRFMSDTRTITNIIGNAVGTVIIAKAEKEFS